MRYLKFIAMEKVAMFGSGNSKEKLQEKYNKLMQESFELSTVNRKKSDFKRAEAEEIGKQLDELEKKS
ncbi:MAG: Lacal_2735 family protein [Pirellulaceae bacterium]